MSYRVTPGNTGFLGIGEEDIKKVASLAPNRAQKSVAPVIAPQSEHARSHQLLGNTLMVRMGSQLPRGRMRF